MGGGNFIVYIFHLLCGMPTGIAGPMWFVYSLFFIKVIDFTVTMTENNIVKISVYIFLCMFGIGFSVGVFPFMRPISFVFVAFPFYIMGKYIVNRIISYWKLSSSSRLISILGVIVIPIIGVYSNKYVDLFYGIFGSSGILYFVFGFLESISILYFFYNFFNYESNYVKDLARGSILVVSYHMLLLLPANYIEDVFPVRYIYAFVVLLFFLYPIRILMKHAKFLLGNR